MSFESIAMLYALGLLAGMLLLIEVGRRIGARRLAIDPEGARAGAGPVEAAAFGLLGLLLAFTFSGAATRFDGRRDLVVEEANAIGTAYLRIDVLPPERRPEFRDRFRKYLDSRIEIYRLLPDVAAARAELDRSNTLQSEIWSESVKACQGSQPASMLLLPALNAMIDITTTRTAATLKHPPGIIFAMLFALSLGCALLVGYSMASGRTRNWMHAITFAVMIAATVHVIVDIEYPRLGFIRVDAIDQVLVDLRASMK